MKKSRKVSSREKSLRRRRSRRSHRRRSRRSHRHRRSRRSHRHRRSRRSHRHRRSRRSHRHRRSRRSSKFRFHTKRRKTKKKVPFSGPKTSRHHTNKKNQLAYDEKAAHKVQVWMKAAKVAKREREKAQKALEKRVDSRLMKPPGVRVRRQQLAAQRKLADELSKAFDTLEINQESAEDIADEFSHLALHGRGGGGKRSDAAAAARVVFRAAANAAKSTKHKHKHKYNMADDEGQEYERLRAHYIRRLEYLLSIVRRMRTPPQAPAEIQEYFSTLLPRYIDDITILQEGNSLEEIQSFDVGHPEQLENMINRAEQALAAQNSATSGAPVPSPAPPQLPPPPPPPFTPSSPWDSPTSSRSSSAASDSGDPVASTPAPNWDSGGGGWGDDDRGASHGHDEWGDVDTW